MPQMSPNSWLTMLILVSTNMMMINSMNFFNQKNIKKNNQIKMTKYIYWKW